MFKLTFPIPCLPLSVKGLPERITSRKKYSLLYKPGWRNSQVPDNVTIDYSSYFHTYNFKKSPRKEKVCQHIIMELFKGAVRLKLQK